MSEGLVIGRTREERMTELYDELCCLLFSEQEQESISEGLSDEMVLQRALKVLKDIKGSIK